MEEGFYILQDGKKRVPSIIQLGLSLNGNGGLAVFPIEGRDIGRGVSCYQESQLRKMPDSEIMRIYTNYKERLVTLQGLSCSSNEEVREEVEGLLKLIKGFESSARKFGKTSVLASAQSS